MLSAATHRKSSGTSSRKPNIFKHSNSAVSILYDEKQTILRSFASRKSSQPLKNEQSFAKTFEPSETATVKLKKIVTAPNNYAGKVPALVSQDIKNRSNWDILTKTPVEYASDKTPMPTEQI